METKKKGFSLVELICTLTIVAIITAAAVPSAAGYVQNSKLMNYRTALNNLIGELQTQLPQTRYWNWEEVRENAEAILRSDSGREVNVTAVDAENDQYVLSNVSNDADVEFLINLNYETVSGVNTRQKVTITGECADFPSVASDGNECYVDLKGNTVDSGTYPVTYTPIVVSAEKGGWKPMIEKAKPSDEWNNYFSSSGDTEHNYNIGYGGALYGGSSLTFNTTYYPINSVGYVVFEMQRLNGSNQVYPYVSVQDALKLGDQYSPMRSESQYSYENIEIFIGDNTINMITGEDQESLSAIKTIIQNDDNWYSCSGITSDAEFNQLIAEKYSSSDTTKYTNSSNNYVLYRVRITSPDSGAVNSRGWIAISSRQDTGYDWSTGTAVRINAELNNKVFAKVAIEEEYKAPAVEAIKGSSSTWNQSIYFNLVDTGYCVGDVLRLTFHNVDVSRIMGEYAFYVNYLTKANFESEVAKALSGDVYYSPGSNGSVDYTIIDYDIDEEWITYEITMDWDTYPYIRFDIQGMQDDFNPSDFEFTWIPKNSDDNEIVNIPTYVPMVIINGSEDYAVLTFDWSHCDYITSSNVGNMALEFDKALYFEVYDKAYNKLTYNSAPSQVFRPNWLPVAAHKAAVLSDGIVHLYCKGVSADDIVYSISDAPQPPAEGAVTTTSSTTAAAATTTTTATMTVTTTANTESSSDTTAATTSVTAASASTATTTTAATTTTTAAATAAVTSAGPSIPAIPDGGYTVTKTMSISSGSGSQIYYINDDQKDYNITSIVFDIKSCTSWNQTNFRFANSEDILAWSQFVGEFYLQNYGALNISGQTNCSVTLDGTKLTITGFNEAVNQIIIGGGLDIELECTVIYEPIL